MSQDSALTGRSFIGTFALTFVAIAGLFAMDTFLARIEQKEERVEANRLFLQGNELIQHGRNLEAAERFRDAVAIDRDNRDYPLALAKAFLGAKNFMEAESILDDLLQRDPTDGDANLAMAQVLVGQMKIAEGISFYHRAIYGQWRSNPSQNQVKARFELVDLLAGQGAKKDLLAELLPLEDEANEDPETRRRLGYLFLSAGSPSRAAAGFRDLLRQDPQDPDAYDGLGQAELAQGNYQAARADFLSASRLNPGADEIRKRLDLAEQILALDPTRRGLASDERYRRSLKLVKLTLDETNRCVNPELPVPRELLDAADKALKGRVVESRQNAATETNLDLAERIWQSRRSNCASSAGASENALVLVLAKIAQ